MIVGRLVALVALSLAATRAASPQGTPALVIRVLERTTQQPLPNAEVIDLDGAARRFTNAEGEARLAWGPTGRLRLRVRQLGFQFVEQDVAKHIPGGCRRHPRRDTRPRRVHPSRGSDEGEWRHHCFAVHRVETLGQDRVLRLTFVPVPMVAELDWMGTAFVDSATSMLRRVEFQIAGLREDDVPRRLEGFTTFRSPSPFIVIPDSTVAMWWRREASTYTNGWKGPDVVQLLQLQSVNYRKATPTGVRR